MSGNSIKNKDVIDFSFLIDFYTFPCLLINYEKGVSYIKCFREVE